MAKESTVNVVKKMYADGRVEEGDWKMTLDEMQRFVGGYIQMVPTRTARRALVMDEEGLLKGKPRNEKASAELHPDFDWSGQPGHAGFSLVGDALVIKSNTAGYRP